MFFEDLHDLATTLRSQGELQAQLQLLRLSLASSEQVRGLCNNVVPENLQALRRAVLEDRLAVEVVVTDDAFDAVAADPDVREVVRDLLDSGRVDLAVCSAALPHLAILADDTVLLLVADDEGAIRGTVETESDAARAWFATAFDAYHRDAERVAPDVLTT